MARFLAAKQLRALLLDRQPQPQPSTPFNKSLDRAFHRWLRASKLLHDPPPFAASSSSSPSSDPVLPSRPACQRDLPLAQALLANAGLTAEAAAEACEAVGQASVAAAAALSSGRYDGEEGVGGKGSGGGGSGGGKRRRKGPSALDAGAEAAAPLLHPLSRLEQPPVLRSRHHRPCLYLPLSAPALGERLEALEVCA